jgi:phosphatidylserine decarboxylase
MKFAPEGRWHLAAALALFVPAAGLAIAGVLPLWAALVLFVPLAFVLQFFREPARVVADAPDAALAPADGRVVFVGAAKNPYRGDCEALKIAIFMNPFNVHSNRAPLAGTVCDVAHYRGKFFNAALDKASAQNERCAMTIKNERGETTCAQVAGFVARRILCHAKSGDALRAGERYGFIRFGSRVDVYLPPTAKPAVAAGEKTVAGISVIARFDSGADAAAR